MDYESPVVAALRRAYWSSGEDGEAIWNTFVDGFARSDAHSRRQSLQNMDTYLSERTSVTREHADLIARRRQMASIHDRLWAAGR
jgi:hypothetical protein